MPSAPTRAHGLADVVYTPTPTPAVIDDTVSESYQAAQTYEEIRAIHNLLLFLLPLLVILIALQWFRVRR